MKTKVCVWVVLAVFLLSGTAAWAAERIVALNVPGCRPCGAAARISKIMSQIDGVIKHENRETSTLVITYDDQKTTLTIITAKLEEGNFYIKGLPVYLK